MRIGVLPKNIIRVEIHDYNELIKDNSRVPLKYSVRIVILALGGLFLKTQSNKKTMHMTRATV